ncbi:hypothetical protein MF672_013320 [Actinomadura sp. ATCC 31491]|uniref:Integrase n=1 Tax=Actinomadura luzonensis TaxID=2805427 RepID=A0ABT0FR11_9ACTN|nr:hypothetical protein [Actinomadura luzonensis]MCK2214766.1 hypothetical protein [Actinomadura luzonensis]
MLTEVSRALSDLLKGPPNQPQTMSLEKRTLRASFAYILATAHFTMPGTTIMRLRYERLTRHARIGDNPAVRVPFRAGDPS